jgi:DNA-binding NarL/FixJ family response regulator
VAVRPRVLIVDDDPLFRGTLRVLLADDLEVVAEAGDGEEALAAAAGCDVDLIVMDVSMPRLSGIDATRAVLDRDPALVVVILSGSERDLGQQALAAGATAYVRKTSELSELVELLVALGNEVAPPAL